MLALLHTSPVHVPVFDALRDEDHPGLTLLHLVDEDLLARAREEGPEAVAPAVADVLAGAVAEGAAAVLVTCSTIGGVAEACAEDLGVVVLRADRPMAAVAAAANRIVVVAALRSTLEPTVALLREEAAAARSTSARCSSTAPGSASRRATAMAIWTPWPPRSTGCPPRMSSCWPRRRWRTRQTVRRLPSPSCPARGPGCGPPPWPPRTDHDDWTRRAWARAPGDIGNARL